MIFIQSISTALGALQNCQRNGCHDADLIWTEVLDRLERELPRGSGFDAGTKIDRDSDPEKIRFTTSFHHMNDGGYYDGWTEHVVTISPSFQHLFDVKVSGRDRNQIKDLIATVFRCELNTITPWRCSYKQCYQDLTGELA